ncbi:MAG: sulfurtransferase complex subunit TusC [Sedimenticola sp.]|jgi:tRNA 2-thiouridine synthesizing protein C|nr:MAG: sulfurtransferase complex subunit TusC [Sedimenticola sp.]
MSEEMMEGEVVKKFMYINRRAPYGSIYALESLEVVLIGAAFDQDVSLAFVDDGVFELKKDQETAGIDMKNFSPTYRALEMYDVEKLYVSKESMDARGLTVDDLIVDVEVKTDAELADLFDDQDVIFSF